ncbi:hypothetical protein B0J14DRAFT_556941 [Halenospora varia]|nr:hypothetical protein B0J14DRAFT_556941 [Halenospora varia]
MFPGRLSLYKTSKHKRPTQLLSPVTDEQLNRVTPDKVKNRAKKPAKKQKAPHHGPRSKPLKPQNQPLAYVAQNYEAWAGVDQSKPLKEFHFFSKLPKELRAMIWEECKETTTFAMANFCTPFTSGRGENVPVHLEKDTLLFPYIRDFEFIHNKEKSHNGTEATIDIFREKACRIAFGDRTPNLSIYKPLLEFNALKGVAITRRGQLWLPEPGTDNTPYDVDPDNMKFRGLKAMFLAAGFDEGTIPVINFDYPFYNIVFPKSKQPKRKEYWERWHVEPTTRDGPGKWYWIPEDGDDRVYIDHSNDAYPPMEDLGRPW